MFTTKFAALAAVVSFGLFAAGCAAEATEQAASAESEVRTETFVAGVQEGTFKLYDEPSQEPTEACDIHTVLTLTHDEGGATATLRDVVTGVCFLYVEPNERTFDLFFETNRCNTHTLSGETTVNGETRHIAITDNRNRMCDSGSRAAEIIVDEYDSAGRVTTRYSQQ